MNCMEESSPAIGILEVDLSGVVEEESHVLRETALGGEHQRGLKEGGSLIDIAPGDHGALWG
jgi:hypothetical protein